MGIMQKKKLEELEQQEAAGDPGNKPKDRKPVFHVHKDKQGNFIGGHFIETVESFRRDDHLDSLLERLENKKKDEEK